MQINAPNQTTAAGSGNYADQNQQTGTQAYNQGQQTANVQTNTYAPGAAANQQAASDALQGVLTGSGGPTENMGLGQAAYDTWNRNFNQTVAHQLAAQGGAGSPMIPLAQMQGLNDLAVADSQMQWQNMHGIFDDVAKVAYNPTGAVNQGAQQQAGTNTQQQSGNSNGNYNSVNADIGGVLTGLFTGLGGTF